MLPQAKLDILLAHHASLEAELLGQLDSEKYVQITRELAELNPLIDAVKTYRAARSEIADAESLLADPATDPEMRSMAEAELETLQARVIDIAHRTIPLVKVGRQQWANGLRLDGDGFQRRCQGNADFLDAGAAETIKLTGCQRA